MRPSLLAVSLLILSLPARAQTDLKRFEVSVFGGYLYGGTVSDNRFPDLTSPTGLPIENRGHIQFDNAATYGLRVDYRLSRWLLFEAQASSARNSLVFSRLPLTQPNAHGFRTDYYLGYLVLERSRSALRPFVAIGVGATHFDPADDPPDRLDETRFAASLGVGLKALIHDRWGFRVDARSYLTRLGGNGSLGYSCTTFQGEPPDPIVPVPCERRHWLTNGEFSGGLLFVF